MSVEMIIEPEGLRGLVAEKTYLLAACRRLGLRLVDECGGHGQCDSCAVKITAGAELLSPPTQAEQEQLSAERLTAGERLACQARIERAGVLTLSAVTKTITEEEDPMRDFQKDFSQLSLQQKFSTLFRLEMNALSDALSAVSNLPSQIGEMGFDFLAQKGRQREHNERTARQPNEHKTADSEPRSETF